MESSSTFRSELRPRASLALRRSGSVMTGVCSGIASYADIDPVVVRACTVALAFTGAWVVPTYVALAFVLPADCNEDERGAAWFDGFALVQQLQVGFKEMLRAAIRRDSDRFHAAWHRQIDHCRRAWTKTVS